MAESLGDSDADLPRRLLAAYRRAAGPLGEERARAAATRRALQPASGRDAGVAQRTRPTRGVSRRRTGWTGPGPDPRDPKLLSGVLEDLVRTRGWRDAQVAGDLERRWAEIVGADVAGHSRPVSLVDGDLLVAADSTAWATQLRLLAPRVLERIRAEVAPDAVRSVRVEGPRAPSWSRGRLRVQGRGPRDTYG